MNPLDPLKRATVDGDVMTKIDDAHGRYKDAVSDADLMSKLPQASLPQAPDPTPFSIGPLGAK